MSTVSTDRAPTSWSRTATADEQRPPMVRRRGGSDEAAVEAGLRFAAVRVGYWLGWASIVVVIAGLALDVGSPHRRLLVAATLAAAACNTVAMLIPWREWLSGRRGRLLLDAWCAGLIAFVALLVATAGSSFTLLLFLAVPFIAVVQAGWRRGFWLACSAGTCVVVAAVLPLSATATLIRLMLVAVAVAVALVLARAIRREATARERAAGRAELERALAIEANHRIKNDLQTAADLLLLARPSGDGGDAFDESAARIRSIATVHRLLTETHGHVDGRALLESIASGISVPVDVEAEAVVFDPATAQRLGIVANELLTNACRHGTPPIQIRLTGGDETRLRVDDRGAGNAARGTGLGLELVRLMVEKGLAGRFELSPAPGGTGTRAEVSFPARQR